MVCMSTVLYSTLPLTPPTRRTLTSSRGDKNTQYSSPSLAESHALVGNPLGPAQYRIFFV